MLRAIFRNSGFDPRRLWKAWGGWWRYRWERKAFRSASGAESWAWGRELPMLSEWDQSAGHLGAYFFQDLAVARWVLKAAPERHVDIGSRIDGFIGHLALFREVEVLDIRPMDQIIPGVRFHQLDLMAALPDEWTDCTDSLSCLHTVEHFGLGRYGDRIDPLGHERGIESMKKMVKPGGHLYLSTPIGEERIEFNAHRVFAPDTVAAWFGEGWKIERSACLDHHNRLAESPDGQALLAHRGNLGLGMVVARRAS